MDSSRQSKIKKDNKASITPSSDPQDTKVLSHSNTRMMKLEYDELQNLSKGTD